MGLNKLLAEYDSMKEEIEELKYNLMCFKDNFRFAISANREFQEEIQRLQKRINSFEYQSCRFENDNGNLETFYYKT